MNPGNYESHIHDEAYRSAFYEHLITADSWVTDHGDEPESLSGLWQFAVDQYDTCLRARWFEERTHDESGRPLPLDWDFEAWDTISVPSCWNTAVPELALYEGPVVYTRTFEYQRGGGERRGRRVFLRFHGVAYEAFVFLNQRYLGCHRGASTGFCIEVTDHLQPKNRILIVADNTRRRHQVPMTNTDWFNYGGLYRDVELLRLPAAFIRDARVALIPDGTFEHIRVAVAVDTPEDAGRPAPSDRALAETESEPGEVTVEIPGLRLEEAVEIGADGRGELVMTERPQLWSPDRPTLYECRISYGEDTVAMQIGFREIRVSGTRILLNGEEVFLRGISCHEDDPATGKTLAREQVERDFAVARELGCNYVRLAHYPHSQHAARVADQLGLMLWAEIPVYWAIDFENEATFADARNQLHELIARDANRASVIIWSVGNENPDTDARLNFMRRLAEFARAQDPTRPVSAACLVDKANNVIDDRLAPHLDIIGLNEYFGWYDPDFSKLPRLLADSRVTKPLIITETGAGALVGHRGGISEYFTEDMQRHIYEQQISALRHTEYLRGISPWILFDFRCPRRTNRFQRGYNRKGLVDETRTYRKRAFSVLQSFYQELAVEQPHAGFSRDC
jgi:beta-glucuronidase